jgi:hypothetical protein
MHAVDKFNLGVWWERIALVDPKSLIQAIPVEELIKFHVRAEVEEKLDIERPLGLYNGVKRKEMVRETLYSNSYKIL